MFNEYEIVKMLSDAQNYRAQQEAAAYGAQSQTGGAGALGAILAGINGYRSNKRADQAAEAQAQAEQMQYERDQEVARQQAEAGAEKERLLREQYLKDQEIKRQHDLNLATTKATAGHSNALALQDDKQAFEAQKIANQRAYETANKKPDFKQGDALRKEFQSLPPVKAFDEINSSYEKMVNTVENTREPTGATDISLITGFMKMIDPGSTVREGEFANAASAAGLGDRIIQMAKRVDSGVLLSPDMRSDFMEAANQLYTAHADQYGRLRNQYGELAQRQGMNPDDIFIKRNRLEYGQERKESADISGMSDEDLMKALQGL